MGFSYMFKKINEDGTRFYERLKYTMDQISPGICDPLNSERYAYEVFSKPLFKIHHHDHSNCNHDHGHDHSHNHSHDHEHPHQHAESTSSNGPSITAVSSNSITENIKQSNN